MASPYYTKQPVYLEEPSGRYNNILSNEGSDSTDGLKTLSKEAEQALLLTATEGQ